MLRILFKKIKLHNIRSYISQEIIFSEGSLLLSGDIGSGKSSVLLGIEFALFGAKSAELPASSLLRNGTKEGSVELHFVLEGREIIIKRNLKRGKQGIKQETGYIVVNGTKKELSPVEMKAEIFELLGYPHDLVSKNKDLIYRYTVYTPQEELKRILFDDKDARLNTLRKVFNVDKYKRIKENATVFSRSIKEKSRELAGFISDLEEKKKMFSEGEHERYILQSKLHELLPKIDVAKEHVSEKRGAITLFESKVKEIAEIRNEYKMQEHVLETAIKERSDSTRKKEELESHIAELQKETKTEVFVNADLNVAIESLMNQIGEFRNQHDASRQKVHEFSLVKKQSEELMGKIETLQDCPLCLQTVSDSHKHSITEIENKKIAHATSQTEVHTKTTNEISQKIVDSEKKLEELRKQQQAVEVLKLKQKSLADKIAELKSLEEKGTELKKRIGEANVKKVALWEKIEAGKDIDESYQKAKSMLDLALEEEKRLLIDKNGFEKELQAHQKTLLLLKQEIEKKEKSKKDLGHFIELLTWLSDFFMHLMGTIERHVMLQVHREFSELFKEWFNILIEDETISVRIDDEFSPIVEQNGYDTSIDNLSGGEKTAVALSYRLALNKVINDVISGIKTKDILVLDEPTDGFSTEQLDKVRDILNQLDMKQVILVSHETKIESFVDSIIKIGKDGHESMVVG